MLLKPCFIQNEQLVLLLEQNNGQELWVLYKEFGWKAYLRSKSGSELGWEVPVQDGVPGGVPSIYSTGPPSRAHRAMQLGVDSVLLRSAAGNQILGRVQHTSASGPC